MSEDHIFQKLNFLLVYFSYSLLHSFTILHMRAIPIFILFVFTLFFFSFFLCNARSSSALSFFHASPSAIFKPLNVLKREGSVVVPVFSVPRLFHSPDQGTVSILRCVLANFSVPLAQRNAPDARPRTLELGDFVWFRDTVIIKEA